MDSICHQIYGYVIKRKKVCAFSIIRDLKLDKETVMQYLSQLVKEKLIRTAIFWNDNRKFKKDAGLFRKYMSPVM